MTREMLKALKADLIAHMGRADYPSCLAVLERMEATIEECGLSAEETAFYELLIGTTRGACEVALRARAAADEVIAMRARRAER